MYVLRLNKLLNDNIKLENLNRNLITVIFEKIMSHLKNQDKTLQFSTKKLIRQKPYFLLIHL